MGLVCNRIASGGRLDTIMVTAIRKRV